MDSKPLVSVVIATYNMAEYLPLAVQSALDQTYRDLEIIIVDDGSTDETPTILDRRWSEDPRVRLITQENQGQTAAKNRGIAAATGKYVAFLDADDQWVRDKLEKQVPRFGDSPKIAVVYSDQRYIDEYGAPLHRRGLEYPEGLITEQLLVDNFVNFSSAVVKREVLEEFGGFDATLPMSIDYDLWLRISTGYEFRCVNEVLVDYRIWPGQMSHKSLERTTCVLRILQKLKSTYPDIVSARSLARAQSSTLVTRGHAQISAGFGRLAALREIGHALKLNPLSARAWKSAAKIILAGR